MSFILYFCYIKTEWYSVN